MPTKEQLDAFEKYDFNSDERWINYFNNVTIPPGRSDGIAIVRRYKQKFYQKYVDPTFEVQTLSEAAQSSGRGSSASTSAPDSSSSERSSSNPPNPPRAQAGPGPQFSRTAGTGSREWVTFQFLSNAFIIIMAVVAMFPLSPPSVGFRCFSLCLFASFVSSVLGIYQKFRLPRGFNWEAIKLWIQNVSATPEFLAIMHCGAFMPSQKPVLLAVVPIAVHVAPDVAEFLQRNVNRAQIYQSYLQKPCTWLTTNRTLVNLFAANMEISLGVLVIVLMFTPQRNLLMLFFYWQILKLEFHSPASAWYHRQVWAQLGARVEPLLQSYAPFLLTPLNFAKTWFSTVPGAR